MKKSFFYLALVCVAISCQREQPLEKADRLSATAGSSAALLTVSPNSLKIADRESFYGIYTSSSQWGACAVKTSNTVRKGSGTYLRQLTDAEKDLIGNSIDFRIELYAAYDEWDRIATSWYIKVPKGTTTLEDVDYNSYVKTSFIHYTTPYFLYSASFNHITYKRDVSTFAYDLRDKNYDVYIGYEIGANPSKYLPSGWEDNYCDYPGFEADIFIDTKDTGTISDSSALVVVPLLSKDLTSGMEVSTVSFALDQDVTNAYIRISSSGHGNEEGANRTLKLSVDDTQAGSFSTKVICTPYSYYDGINPYGAKCSGCTWRYPYRNWCQGGEVAPVTVQVGNLTKGTHTFKLDAGTRVEPSAGETTIDNTLVTYAVLIADKKDAAVTGVRFYMDASYGGAVSQPLAKGNYTLSQLQAKGVLNDGASSVKIPAGWQVIMYEHNNFSGRSWTLTADNSWLGGLSPSANDKMSSVKIQ